MCLYIAHQKVCKHIVYELLQQCPHREQAGSCTKCQVAKLTHGPGVCDREECGDRNDRLPGVSSGDSVAGPEPGLTNDTQADDGEVLEVAAQGSKQSEGEGIDAGAEVEEEKRHCAAATSVGSPLSSDTADAASSPLSSDGSITQNTTTHDRITATVPSLYTDDSANISSWISSSAANATQTPAKADAADHTQPPTEDISSSSSSSSATIATEIPIEIDVIEDEDAETNERPVDEANNPPTTNTTTTPDPNDDAPLSQTDTTFASFNSTATAFASQDSGRGNTWSRDPYDNRKYETGDGVFFNTSGDYKFDDEFYVEEEEEDEE